MKTRILLIFTFLAWAFTSCKLEYEDEKLQNKDKELLKDYLAQNKITVQPTADGLYYIERVAGTGAAPADTDYVMVNTKWYLLTGRLVGTNDTTLAYNNDIYPFVLYKGPLKYYVPGTLIGIGEGLLKMKEGGKATFIIPNSIALGGYQTNTIPRYSSLRVEMELLRVIKDPVADDMANIRRYLDTLQLTEQDKIDGIYLKIDKEGTGDLIGDLDTVKLTYSSRALDTIYGLGNEIPRTTTYIDGQDSILTGLRVALMKLKKGSEARVILPYEMAYGRTGSYFYKYDAVRVPSYTSFYYKLVINDVGKW